MNVGILIKILSWISPLLGGKIAGLSIASIVSFLNGSLFGIPVATIIAELPQLEPELKQAESVIAGVVAKLGGSLDALKTGLKAVAKTQYMEPGSALEQTWANRGMILDPNHTFPEAPQ